MARKYTNAIIDLMDEGVLNPRELVIMALSWMSESEVEDFCEANELLNEEWFEENGSCDLVKFPEFI